MAFSAMHSTCASRSVKPCRAGASADSIESRGGQADRVEALAAAQLDCALKGRQEPSGTAHVRFHGAHGAGDLDGQAACSAFCQIRYPREKIDRRKQEPVSYTMPLPTRQTVSVGDSGSQESTASAGGFSAAFPTPQIPP